MPKCYMNSFRRLRNSFIQENENGCSEMDIRPTRVSKYNFKRQKNLLKNNETIYHDKVPISTRFYLQLLKKSQFVEHFVNTESYEYASETEKAVNYPDIKRNNSLKKEVEKSNYNLRSSECKTERKSFYDSVRKRRKSAKSNENTTDTNMADVSRKRKHRKEPLAPIIEEIIKREPLKCTNKGSEIDKIAEKLKSLVKTNANEKINGTLNEETLEKESFDNKVTIENGAKLETLKENGTVSPSEAKEQRPVHKCTYCSKTFDRPWVLKGHMRLHTGERPFPCPHPQCGRNFADRSNLRAHQRTRGHHTWRWRCLRCGKPFSQPRYVDRHSTAACDKYRQHNRNAPKEVVDPPEKPLVPLYGVILQKNLSKDVIVLDDEEPIDLSIKKIVQV